MALFILKGHGNKGDEGLFFMISSNLKYCKQINSGAEEMFISLQRLRRSFGNVLIYTGWLKLEDNDQSSGSTAICTEH